VDRPASRAIGRAGKAKGNAGLDRDRKKLQKKKRVGPTARGRPRPLGNP
jgi:hypothetical protein